MTERYHDPPPHNRILCARHRLTPRADPNHAFAIGLAALITAAIAGAALVLFVPSTPPAFVLMVALSPIISG